MINNYDSFAVYEIFQITYNGKKNKIGEIQNFIFYDIDKNRKRIMPGYNFTNSESFWDDFGNVSIQKTSRPLRGFEPMVWGAYWTIHVLVTIVLLVASPPDGQIFWGIFSAIIFAFSVKHRHCKIVVYYMLICTVVFLLLLYFTKTKKQ